MRAFKSYMVFFILIIVLILIKNDFNGKKLMLDKMGSESGVEADIWNPLIAKRVNESSIDAVVDGEKYVSDNLIYMADDLQLMIPVNDIRDIFDCSVKEYQNDKVVIEKSMKKMEFSLNSFEVKIDGVNKEYNEALIKKNDELYIPLSILKDGLNVTYDWDIKKNEVIISSSKNTIPYKYDLRKEEKIASIKNQGDYGTCWAFAALSAIESTLLPKEEMELSPDHMTRNNSFNIDVNIGGGYTMGMAYLVNWQGPVLEKDDPYGDGVTTDGLNAVKHVQKIQILKEKDYEDIKKAIYKYGGVQSSIYSSLTNLYSKSVYYNNKTSSYCYIGTEKPNHEIVIIGWDDNYPKENFNTKLEGDGAFICQNSWGELFGDKGVFYVSYYDTNIGMHNLVYTLIEDNDNYDNIYQSDLCGWVGQIGYGTDSAYAANVYKAKDNEVIKSVGLYATDVDTEYDIYVVDDFKDIKDLNVSNNETIASGVLKNQGYYTIPIEDIEVNKDKKFAIVCKLMVPNSVHPIAIEYQAGELTENVDLSDGEGYISMYGNNWSSTEQTQECNICLKAYTNRSSN